jgi:flagellar hook-basal body complex protein FliE
MYANFARAFQRGSENIDISQVMIASQKASVEFQLMMQARNRLISAYQDIMSMQI